MTENAHRQLTNGGALGVAAAVFLFAWTLTTHGKYSVSGDEPHYLMIAESIRTDGDLDLANNYAQNDGRLFGYDNLPIELHAARALNGELHSIHALGIAVFSLPVYATAQQVAAVIPENQLRRFRMGRGLFAYSLVSLSLIAMTAAGLGLLAAGLSNVAGRRSALLIAIAIGISPPVVSHSFLIFPEVIALFVSCCVVWFVTKSRAHADVRWLMFLALGVGLLPWFHQKYLLYTIGLCVVVAWRRADVLRSLTTWQSVVALGLFAGPQLAVLLWLHHEWGSVGGALTTGTLTAQAIPLTLQAFAAGAVGLLFDRQSGLAAYAPLFWVVPACVVLTWKKTWDLVLAVLVLYVPAAAFVIGWWAGFSPAARYLVPAVPLLALTAAYAMKHRVVRAVAAALLVVQLVFDALVWQNPRWLWPGTDHNRLLDALSVPGRVYSRLLAPVKMSGLTLDALVPVALALGVTIGIVLLVRVPTRAPR